MSKGLWPAVSGSIAQSQRLDAIANNIANADTNAFKRDQVSFQSYLTSAEKAHLEEDIPRRPYTDKDFHRLDGRDQSFVAVNSIDTDFSQGHVKITNSPLDVALEGKGFLEVQTPNGVRYTRQGNLKLSADGTLVTTDGYPVVAKHAGAAATPGRINIDTTKANPITITMDGGIYQGKDLVSELSVVEFVDPRLLVKEGNTLFKNDVTANALPETKETRVRQGMLEASNVNPVSELTEMLKANRLFEANEKVIKNYSDLEQRSVSDIGKL